MRFGELREIGDDLETREDDRIADGGTVDGDLDRVEEDVENETKTLFPHRVLH